MPELRNPSTGTTEPYLEEPAVQKFKSEIQGEVLRPGDPGYNQARHVWNGMIDRHPALIARCRTSEHVAEAVRFAQEHNLSMAVRGGGHGVSGLAVCDGGLVVDLTPMKEIRVDPKSRSARAEGGVTWGELDLATQAHSLAVPGGMVSETGIAGLTLNGGLGWLRRRYGLSCDNLLSAEVATADGRVLTASDRENPDLFWALRGGGGNFGVVTSFEFRLHPVGPEVMFGLILYPAERARDILPSYRSYAANAPDEVTSLAIFATVPRHPPFEPNVQGRSVLIVGACYADSVRDGERALAPLRKLADPLMDFSSPTPYVQMQKVFDEDYPPGRRRYYWKSVYEDRLSDEVIDRLIAHAEKRPSPLSTIAVWHLGGAIRRLRPQETAFHHRAAAYLIGCEANWDLPEDDVSNVLWVRNCISDLRRFSDGVVYLNFPGFLEEGEDMMRAAYGANYERLMALKTQYDPANVFHLNQNIKPLYMAK
ncbi:MAG: FAD-binding oxidoreductase [Elusimicrobia bacterium]|nr:FAD-binding oxidoreductase [Elusimicrobiota bacterium]